MKINIKNQDKLQAALDSVQSKALVRTANASEIEALVARIEDILSTMLYKKDWVGLRFILDPNGQNFPNAYKGVPESTQVEVERHPSGWFVARVIRQHAKTHEITTLNIHEYKQELADHAACQQVWNQ